MPQNPESLENCYWNLGGQQQPLLLMQTVNCRRNSFLQHQILRADKCSCQNLDRIPTYFSCYCALHTGLYLCSIQITTALYFKSSSSIWIPSVSASHISGPVSFKSVLAHLPEDLNPAHFCKVDYLILRLIKTLERKINKKGEKRHLHSENETKLSRYYSLPSPTCIYQAGAVSSKHIIHLAHGYLPARRIFSTSR